MSRPEVPDHVHRNSDPAGRRRVSIIGDFLVWGLGFGLVPMTWNDDDRTASEAFRSAVPTLFPRAAKRPPLADEAEHTADEHTAGNLYARHYARRVIDDTLAHLGKKSMFALSGGRLTVYRPAQTPADRQSKELPHSSE